MNYIMTPLQGYRDSAVIKPKEDVAYYLQQAGFIAISYPRQAHNFTNWQSMLAGTVATVQPDDNVIYQTPTWAGMDIENEVVRLLKQRGANVIAFVHDIEYVRFPDRFQKNGQIDYYNQFTGLIVATEPQRQRLMADGVRVPIIVSGPWSYLQERPLVAPSYSQRVHYAGNLVSWKSGFLSRLGADTRIEVYGSNNMEHDLGYSLGAGVNYHGSLTQVELTERLSNGFGLIWDEDDHGHYTDYALTNMPHKFSLYLSLGMPIIGKRGSVVGQLIERFTLGWVLDDISALAELVAGIDQHSYDRHVAQSMQAGRLVRSGRYTQLAALKAIMAIDQVSPF